MTPEPKVIYSFIIDADPKFAYQGWHLARSIVHHAQADKRDINIQVTPAVSDSVRAAFANEGYALRDLTPFGDGKFCNKLAQLPNLMNEDCDFIVLLDTDMIAVGDCRPLLLRDGVQAKVVDFANPKLDVLKDIIKAAGGEASDFTEVEANDALTLLGNANGGFYAIPKALAQSFSEAWRAWALWLFENDTILRAAGRMKNVDQVSAAMAFRLSGIPYLMAPSNLNYYMNSQGERKYFNENNEMCFIHYHDASMSAEGLIAPDFQMSTIELEAVARANALICDGRGGPFGAPFKC